MFRNLPARKRKRLSWQQFVGLVFGIPAILYPMEYWGYVSGSSFFPNFSPVAATLVCALSGMLLGLMWVSKEPFTKNLIPRIIAGTVFGSLTIWVFDAYLYVRGNPKEIYEIEGFVVCILTLIPTSIVYKLLTPGSAEPVSTEEDATPIDSDAGNR